MKNLILIIFLMFSLSVAAQKVVKLNVRQPPEFGFYVSDLDTTIVRGGTLTLGTDLVVFGGSGNYEYNWTPGTTLNDSTLFNPLATPTDTTVYLLTVSDSLGCSFSIKYKVNVREQMVISESAQVPGKLTAVLFPNPNDGNFKVKLYGIQTDMIEISIIDITGKIIKKQVIRDFQGECVENFQIRLVNGVYYLLIHSGTETLTRQFIIN